MRFFFVARIGSAMLSRGEAAAMLGLSETASAADARRAYRKLARTAHPDRGGSVDTFLRLRTALDAFVSIRHVQLLVPERAGGPFRFSG